MCDLSNLKENFSNRMAANRWLKLIRKFKRPSMNQCRKFCVFPYPWDDAVTMATFPSKRFVITLEVIDSCLTWFLGNICFVKTVQSLIFLIFVFLQGLLLLTLNTWVSTEVSTKWWICKQALMNSIQSNSMFFKAFTIELIKVRP